MALRSVSFYLRVTGKNPLSKNLSFNFYHSPISHVHNHQLSSNIAKSLYSHKIFQSNRLYHVSAIINYNTERPDLRSIKPSSEIPIIEPEKINEVLSEVKNLQVKVKDTNVEVKNDKTPDSPKEEKPISLSVRIVERVKKEFWHYYHGFRLLFLEIRIACGILLNLSKGHTLTRRERKQLVRTTADLARMVPFLVFIAVPFMELLLPFYIKIFPFMMPSTFQASSKEKEKTRQLLKGKLEMAKFLQDTLEETRNIHKYSSEATITLESFNQFMKQVRETGQTASTSDIVKFSRLFEDEVTLESLEHGQLKALCKLLELNSIGPKTLLGFHLRLRVHQLKVDDKMIAKEGIDKLQGWELQQLCRERGMRAMGVSEDRLRFQLKQWLKLSIDRQVPISLLLLSRTMYLPDHLSPEQQLTKVIFTLPQAASKEASLRSNKASEKFDSKTKFELLKEEQDAIIKEKKAAKQAETIRVSKETLVDKAPVVSAQDGVTMKTSTIAATETVAIEKREQAVTPVDESISTSDLNEIESAIESLETAKTALQEEELDELKEQTAELCEQIATESKDIATGPKLRKRLQHMIDDMDSLLQQLREQKEALVRNIETTDVATGQQQQQVVNKASTVPMDHQERLIAIQDVMNSLKKLRSFSQGDEVKWQRILAVLDEDQDGQIEVRHVTEVLDLLGSDEVRISGKDMARLLAVIDKADVIDRDQQKQQTGTGTDKVD